MSEMRIHRLTEQSRRILELSLREALSTGHNYIGPEHILLGLIRDTESIPARILSNLGLAAHEIRNETIRQLSKPRTTSKPAGDDLVERIATRVIEMLDERKMA